jgi:redox-sensitive bicupin YhaK (pirin superfamily)
MISRESVRAEGVRGLVDVVTLPAPTQGFIGQGHTAIHVMEGRLFAQTDPFIMLADDRVDLPPGTRAGGPHPHAGFEIVTFAVEGEARDRDEGLLRAGDVLWMTAGSGVVHNEDVEPVGKLRILQLWMTLPSRSRWAPPRFAHMPLDQVPVRRETGIEAHVYSGTSGAVSAPSHTYLPITLIDVRLEPGAVFEQELSASFNGFLYPIDGEIVVAGTPPQRLVTGQIGWLEFGGPATTVRLTAGTSRSRVMVYAGERQNVPIVAHGPFVGETRADLARVSRAYAEGRMPRVSELRR